MVPAFLRQINGDEQRQSSLLEGLVVREGARTSVRRVMATVCDPEKCSNWAWQSWQLAWATPRPVRLGKPSCT
jgi:hypothetical protein